MKIRQELVPECTGEEFGEKYDLEMVVRERPTRFNLPRFYASFSGVDVVDDGMLIGFFGDGDTPQAAIANYWPKISERRVRLPGNRREVSVPRLTA